MMMMTEACWHEFDSEGYFEATYILKYLISVQELENCDQKGPFYRPS